MKTLLEVREYDKITCNPHYQTEYAYLPEPIFYDLMDFIHMFSGDKEHADALEFLKVGYQRNVGDIISVSNYVGLIQMKNGYQVQVLPKIDFYDHTGNVTEGTKRVFLRMLRSLKDFPNKVFSPANLNIDRMSLYEIFINMYLQEVRMLVKRGIKSAYLSKESNLYFFKGKLAFSEHIKSNVAHGERFYVHYDEYIPDRPENRLIKATLVKLGKMTSSADNQKACRQLLTTFETVKSSVNFQKDFEQVVLDRSTKDYDTLLKWSKVFLLNKSFTPFSGTSNCTALMFPMEKVFESYVGQQLKAVLSELEWKVSTQDVGYYLFDSPQKFALRPDIVLTRGDGSKVILDTKWKRLKDNSAANFGISQSDMYQMYAYAKKYNTSEVWLLYPLNTEMNVGPEITFRSNDGVNVHLYQVDVANIENSLTSLIELIDECVVQ